MSDTRQATTIRANDILRFVLELFAIASLAVWGFVGCVDWFPWNIAVGIGAPLLAILLWALFRSPRAVLRVDAFGKALVEIVVMAAAALAWFDLGHPVVAGIFAVVAIVSGVVHGRREFS